MMFAAFLRKKSAFQTMEQFSKLWLGGATIGAQNNFQWSQIQQFYGKDLLRKTVFHVSERCLAEERSSEQANRVRVSTVPVSRVAVILENLDVIDKSVHRKRFPEEQTRRQVNESR